MVRQLNHDTRLAQKRRPIRFAVFVVQRLDGHIDQVRCLTVERPLQCAPEHAAELTFAQNFGLPQSIAGNEVVGDVAANAAAAATRRLLGHQRMGTVNGQLLAEEAIAGRAGERDGGDLAIDARR